MSGWLSLQAWLALYVHTQTHATSYTCGSKPFRARRHGLSPTTFAMAHAKGHICVGLVALPWPPLATSRQTLAPTLPGPLTPHTPSPPLVAARGPHTPAALPWRGHSRMCARCMHAPELPWIAPPIRRKPPRRAAGEPAVCGRLALSAFSRWPHQGRPTPRSTATCRPPRLVRELVGSSRKRAHSVRRPPQPPACPPPPPRGAAAPPASSVLHAPLM